MAKNILIIRFSSLGDIILTSPFVINSKINYPDSKITYLTKEKFRPVVEMMNGVDDVITIDDDLFFFAYLKKLDKISDSNFDLIFDLHGNFRSWWAKKIIKSAQIFTYPKRRHERTQAVKNKDFGENWPHTIDLYNQVLLDSDNKAHATRPLLKPDKIKHDVEIEKFLSENNQFVVIAPSAAHKNKAWDFEKFVETAYQMNKRAGVAIVWADVVQNDLSQLKEKIDRSQLLILNNYPIEKLSSIIDKALLTIANDSGLAHLSSALNTPTLALFGPTHPVLGFSPRGIFDTIIEVDEDCRPCSLHGGKECYRESRFCFDKIEVPRVVTTARRLIDDTTPSEKAVFIDRDGTIIVDKNFLSNPDEIEFEEGALEGLKIIQSLGYKIIIVSNQSGVARGYFESSQVEIVNARLVEMLARHHIHIDAVYYCPHHPEGANIPYNVKCSCRKPAGGMAEEAAYQFKLDLRKSFMIGDKIDDVNFAAVIGAKAFMVRSGYGEEQKSILLSNDFYTDTSVVANILEAAEMIKKSSDD